MNSSIVKTPISCRVSQDLKFELEDEAHMEGLTTSKYIEQILQNRNEPGETIVDVQEDEEMNEMVAEMNEEIFALKKANRELEEEKLKLMADQKEMKEDFDCFATFRFENGQMAFVEKHLKRLHSKYPKANDQELILASLFTTVKNERATFFIHTLKAYFDKVEAQTLVS